MAHVVAHGPTKASVRLADGAQCDLRGVSDSQYPFALHYFTGSKAHNIAMRKRAIARGLKLSEYGLEGPKGTVSCRTEAELFAGRQSHPLGFQSVDRRLLRRQRNTRKDAGNRSGTGGGQTARERRTPF